tara:strand:- start:692 stop:958 length:267 start_codon:yes stop_codon:yes gene_type:complete
MFYFLNIIKTFFTIYKLMLIVRIISSWFQGIQGSSFFRMISLFTDPYLNIFRRFIPLIGGMLDISPIIAFLALQFIEYLILRLLLMLI